MTNFKSSYFIIRLMHRESLTWTLFHLDGKVVREIFWGLKPGSAHANTPAF